MTWVIILVTLVSHFAIPLGFVAWLAFGRHPTRAYGLAVALLTLAELCILQRAGAWSWFGFYWPYVFYALYALALVRFVRGWSLSPWWPERRVKPWLGHALVLAIALFFLSSIPALLSVRAFSGEPVALEFPLQGGAFAVMQGGASAPFNHHVDVPAQKHALDVVKVGPYGLRAAGLLPRELERYAIWGTPVASPCEGDVLAARGDVADSVPPDGDKKHIAGNFVALACAGSTVVLAHFQNASLLVKVGDHVGRGQLLGKVGNSGNTTEPHLHMHAVRGRPSELSLLFAEGEGVPMLFEKRFLARNDIVERP